jgi:hypothetical protein
MRFSADRNAPPCGARPYDFMSLDLIRDHVLLRSGRPAGNARYTGALAEPPTRFAKPTNVAGLSRLEKSKIRKARRSISVPAVNAARAYHPKATQREESRTYGRGEEEGGDRPRVLRPERTDAQDASLLSLIAHEDPAG